MRSALCVCLLLLAPSAAFADKISLVNGDVLNAAVIEQTAERVVIDHPVLGRIEIPTEKIVPPEGPNPGLFGTSFLAGWTRSFQLGVSGATGNTRTTDALAALDFDYEDEERRWAFDAAYRYGRADGETTRNDAFAQIRRDWLFKGSKWFVYAKSRFDYDQFNTWRFRIGASPGVGYQFVKTESFEFRGLVGPSVTKQFSEDEFFVEALVGLEALWKISDNQSISLSNTVYPALNDPGEVRNLSSLAWKWKLLDDPGLSLIAGVDNEYQSLVESDRKHNDLKYSTSLGIDF